jgi:hypothetical protein
LQAFIDNFVQLAHSFKAGKNHNVNAEYPKEGDYDELSLNNQLVHRLFVDTGAFGELVTDITKSTYKIGDTVLATFECAHPRSHGYFNPFMVVERLTGSDW